MPKLLVPKHIAAGLGEPEHIKRLKSVARWRMPQEDTPEWANFRLAMAAAERDPRHRKIIKEAAKTAAATYYAVENNGAGFFADCGLREYISEYNRRTANYGLHYLPASFNVLEAFTSYVPKYGIFIPAQEIDHVCSLRYFLDFQAASISQSPGIGVDAIEEGKTFNYSFLEPPGEWIFTSENERFVLSSFSMIRHGDELTVLALGGIERDLEAITKEIRHAREKMKPDPAKPLLTEDESLTVEAVALDENRKFQRTYFAFRFDLRSRKMQVRYILFDDGASWNVKTDDQLTLGYLSEISEEGDSSLWTQYIEEREGIFALLLRCTELVDFFSEKSGDIVRDRAITGISEMRSDLRGSRKLDGAISSQIVCDRQVATIFGTPSDASSVALPAFELNVEVDGYWERLPFGSYGTGPDGDRVLGRTWVRKVLSRRQVSIPGTSISGALKSTSVSLKDDSGQIYVLRNAAHQVDIFKIGLTRRNVSVRASELSRGTGVPDMFLTVQTWWVPDVGYAEARIHEVLKAYRLKDAREFFKADYPTIRSAVDMVVGELSGRNIPSK